MNINYKQPQFELFPANSATLEDINKPKFFLANLTLSIESLVILTILGIMLTLFSFSLGVERGKHIAAQALDERVSAAWNVAPRKAMLAAPVAAAMTVHPAQAQAVIAVPADLRQGNGGIVTAHRVLAPAVALRSTSTVIKSAVVAPVASRTGRFTIQAASYKSETFAKNEAVSLKAKGLQSFLIKKGEYWLVCVGNFTSQDAANKAQKKIQSKYRGSSVRRF